MMHEVFNLEALELMTWKVFEKTLFISHVIILQMIDHVGNGNIAE